MSIFLQIGVGQAIISLFECRFTVSLHMRMTISGLPNDFDKYDLQRLFGSHGCWVKYARIYINPITGLSARRGLVEIEDDQKAKAAMEALQGKVLDKNPLNIKEVKDNNKK